MQHCFCFFFCLHRLSPVSSLYLSFCPCLCWCFLHSDIPWSLPLSDLLPWWVCLQPLMDSSDVCSSAGMPSLRTFYRVGRSPYLTGSHQTFLKAINSQCFKDRLKGLSAAFSKHLLRWNPELGANRSSSVGMSGEIILVLKNLNGFNIAPLHTGQSNIIMPFTLRRLWWMWIYSDRRLKR